MPFDQKLVCEKFLGQSKVKKYTMNKKDMCSAFFFMICILADKLAGLRKLFVLCDKWPETTERQSFKGI